MKLINGFDYQRGIEVQYSRREWQEIMQKAREKGGWRQVCEGETFIYASNTKIMFEIYMNLDYKSAASANPEN